MTQRKQRWLWAGILVVIGVAVISAQQSSTDDADDRTTPAILVGLCPGALVTEGSMPGLVPNECNSDRNFGEGIPMPSAGTLQHLAVASATHGGDPSDGVFTVFVNGTATLVTCTIGTGLSCINKTDTARVKAGDLVEIRFFSGFGGLSDVRATLNKR